VEVRSGVPRPSLHRSDGASASVSDFDRGAVLGDPGKPADFGVRDPDAAVGSAVTLAVMGSGGTMSA
jgi:hypothetical protein